ncbi:hypothetical protein V3330_14820 [Wenzhouxiangellaceae bacterium CH-27]|uniref:Lipoprotein n=1 Tax=Elongatibacter sediminis TaxID=3119006 RepID=A0AAW9R861_9GAMM
MNAVVAVTLPLLCACSAPPDLTIPRPDAISDGKLASKTTHHKTHGCPNVSGKFALLPREKNFPDEHPSSIALGEYAVFEFVPLHRAEFEELQSSEQNLIRTIGQLIVSQSTEAKLSLTIVWGDDRPPRRYTFSQVQGDFQCEAGAIVFPVRSFEGGLEGQILSGQSRTWMTREEGGLLMLRVSGPLRSSRPPGQVRFTEERARFPSIAD